MHRLLALSTLFLLIFNGLKAQSASSPRPFSIGESLEIQSAILSEKRPLNIYLPPEYNAADTTRYHVVYLLDGSADEDFIHVAGLVQFNTFSWVAQMPPTILVGIGNIDRRRDFSFPSTIEEDKKRFPTSGGSARFMDFLEKELKPFIDARYKTNGHKTLVGQSFGALLATELLLKRPQLFDRYVLVSPSVWWDNGSLLNFDAAEILSKNCTQPTQVYIGVGKEGLAPCSAPHVMEVDANLLAEKLRACENKNLTIHFDYLPAENHATIGHQAVFNAFRLIFKKT